jgi:ABC-type uncharacterized transport system permease subunit
LRWLRAFALETSTTLAERTVEHWPAVIVAGIVGALTASVVAVATINLDRYVYKPPGTNSAPAIAHR